MTNLKYILKELQRTLTLVEGWSLKGEISAIERDLALDKLKALYEAVRFAEPATEELQKEPLSAPILPTPEVEQEPTTEPLVEESFAEELPEEEPAVVDFDELMLVEEVDEKPAPESVPESKPEPEPELEEVMEEAVEKAAEAIEEVAEKVLETVKEAVEEVEETLEEIVEEVASEAPVVQNSLFDMSEIPVHRRSSRRVLMSLYNDAPAPKPEPQPEAETKPESPLAEAVQRELEPQAPAVEPEPIKEPEEVPEEGADEEVAFEEYALVSEPVAPAVVEPTPVLGEVMASEPTLADTLAEAAPMASTLAPAGESLRKMIALNDRFLLRSELFSDNDKAYEEAIDELDNMSSIDDCMIYIAENYAWNANSEAAKLLVELLERKYGL